MIKEISLVLIAIAAGEAAAPAQGPVGLNLTRDECLLKVMEYNESAQMKELEWRISQKKQKAEGGIFEPEFVGSFQHEKNRIQEPAELAQSFGVPILSEINSVYNSGIDYLLDSGAKLHAGYQVQYLKDNIQQITIPHQFQTFAGLSLSQPLLKNGGKAVTTAAIRLAAGASEAAYQDYRKQMTLIMAQAESSYWDLYYFQELNRIVEESVSTSQKILDDAKVRLQTGKATSLDVLEAESGLALREARRNEAAHKKVEAMNKVLSFFSGVGTYSQKSVRAVDQPALRPDPVEYLPSMWDALKNNPDYLNQKAQLVQSNIRVAYAKNQRLPQLDLTASYGLNGLAPTFNQSWEAMETGHFETWSVGVEIHIPLGGGIKSKNELDAAQMRKEEALLGLKSLEVQISAAMDTSVKRIQGLRESVGDYQKASDFNQRLLAAELERLHVGKTDSQKVLQTEERLFEAKRAVQEALVDYQKAFLEWEMGKGTLLGMHNVDFSQNQLKHRTVASLTAVQYPESRTERLMADAKKRYDSMSMASFPAASGGAAGALAPVRGAAAPDSGDLGR